jgi:hypothetical protein
MSSISRGRAILLETSHLGAGRVIIEKLHILGELAGRRCFALPFPLPLKGCGAWTHAVAWELDE